METEKKNTNEEEMIDFLYEEVLDNADAEKLAFLLYEAREMYLDLKSKQTTLTEGEYWEELKWILGHEQEIYKRLYK